MIELLDTEDNWNRAQVLRSQMFQQYHHGGYLYTKYYIFNSFTSPWVKECLMSPPWAAIQEETAETARLPERSRASRETIYASDKLQMARLLYNRLKILLTRVVSMDFLTPVSY